MIRRSDDGILGPKLHRNATIDATISTPIHQVAIHITRASDQQHLNLPSLASDLLEEIRFFLSALLLIYPPH